MKKIFITAALGAVIATGAAAQTSGTATTVTETITPIENRVMSNSFWSNWFIQAGAGAQMGFTEHDRKAGIGNRISPSVEAAIGKWINPNFGIRIAYNGFDVRGATQTWTQPDKYGPHNTGKPIDGKNTHEYGYLYHQKFNYFNLHFDIMVNLCNLIGGYNPDRLYSCIPYAGIGLAHVTDKPVANELAFNCGIQNAFRISKRWDINFNINAMICDERFSGEEGNRHFDALLGATVGATFRFGKTGWETPVTKNVTVVDNDAINRMRGEMAQLEAENARLRALAEKKSAEKVDRVAELIAAGNVIFFKIDTWQITEQSKANLSFLADAIKNTKGIYTVTGYADKGTGTPEWNEELSKKRAEAAYNCLVNEFGVPADRLQIDYKGGVDDMFYNDPRCSRCVIVLPQE